MSGEYTVAYGAIPGVTDAVRALIGKFDENTLNVESKRIEVGGYHFGAGSEGLQRSLLLLKNAEDDFQAALRKLNANIEMASNNFRDADYRGRDLFA